MRIFNNFKRTAGLIVLLFSSVGSIAQSSGFYTTFGLNNSSYLKEGVLLVSNPEAPDSYTSSILSVPTLGLGYKNDRLRSAIEASAYFGIVPTLDTTYDLIYTKYAFFIEYLFYIKNFRVGLGYSLQDQKNQSAFAGVIGFGDAPNFYNGISFNLGYEFDGFLIDLRKEYAWHFYGQGKSEPAALWEYWALRVARKFYLSGERESEKDREPSNLRILLGLNTTINALREEFAFQRFLKFSGVMGLEYFIEDINVSLFARRDVWYALQNYDQNFKVNSQSNYIGASYWLPLSKDRYLKLGLTHNWGLNRGMQVTDLIENKSTFTITNVYQDFSIGADVRYSINPSWDVSMNLDYYYKANPRLGTGFNRESLKLGLIYNLD